jgi:transposase
MEIVKRSDTRKFVVLPKCWIVERTFAWLALSRRLNRDYEINPRHSEIMMICSNYSRPVSVPKGGNTNLPCSI